MIRKVKLEDFEIYFYDTVDSTQDVARSLLGAKEFTTIVAREQLRGRGRFGREWCSPQGGLWFTTILYPRLSANSYAILCLLGSLSVVEAIETIIGLTASIKWPNDVYMNGKKLAGILVESDIVGDLIERSLIGVGVNLNLHLEALPLELRNNATTLLHEYGEPVEEEKFLLKILNALKKNYEEYKYGSRRKLIETIKGKMEMMNRMVFVSMDRGEALGLVRDLETDGALVIESSGTKIVLNPSEIRRLVVI